MHKELVEVSGKITKATQMYAPVEMLSAKGVIADRLEQQLKKYQVLDLLPYKSDIMPSMLDTSELAETINSFGVVLGGSCPGEAKTDLYIPTAIRGKEKRVTVTTCDIQGKLYPYGEERVEVTLSLLGSNGPPLSAAVIDNKDGIYVASFTPNGIGEHRLNICIDSHHIKGSPFAMYVREERDYTNLSRQLQGFGTLAFVHDVVVDDNGDVAICCCLRQQYYRGFQSKWGSDLHYRY